MRASVSDPHAEWQRITADSSGSSGPGLFSTASGTWILPTSCRRAANSSSISDAGSSPGSSPPPRARPPTAPAGEPDDVLGVARRAVVAHIHRGRKRLDVRLHGGVVVLAHEAVLEGGGRQICELAEDLYVVRVELAVVADDRSAQDAADRPAGANRDGCARPRDLVLDDRRAHDLAVVVEQHRPARDEHLPDGALVRPDARANQIPGHAMTGRGYRQPRVARVTH